MKFTQAYHTICFLGLLLVDWYRANTAGNIWAVAINCGGLLFGAILLCYFPWKKLSLRWAFFYTVIWLAGSALGYLWWLRFPGSVFEWQYLTGALNAGWIGLWVLYPVQEALRSSRREAAVVGLRRAVSSNLRRLLSGGKILTAPFILLNLWILLTLCILFSPTSGLWAVWYFAMFLILYSLKLDRGEKKRLWDSMANGVILGFFVLQIYAYGFRPYDDVRYRGAYINCNMNALMYLITYGMTLYRLHDLKLRELKGHSAGQNGCAVERSGRAVKRGGCARERTVRAVLCLKRIFWYLLSGGLLGFILFTLSRTALLAAAVITVVSGVVTVLAVYRQGLGKLLMQWLLIGCCALAAFPAVYLSIRYLPTILHHPVWHVGEYAETKVHSFDPADSEKYVTLQEFVAEAFGRLNYGGLLNKLGITERQEAAVDGIQGSLADKTDLTADAAQPMPESQASSADVQTSSADVQTSSADIQASSVEEQTPSAGALEPGPAALEEPPYEDSLLAAIAEADLQEQGLPLIPEEDWGDSGKVRMAIYRKYLENLNMTGHTKLEGHYQITDSYSSWHAQNVFLQIAYSYGIPAGILCVLLVFWSGWMALQRSIRGRSGEDILPLLVWLIFTVFGMMELVWNTGQLILFLFFFVQLDTYKRFPKNLDDRR